MNRWRDNLGWDSLPLSLLLDIAEPYLPDKVKKWRESVMKFPGRADFVKRMIIHQCRKLGLDAFDKFHPHPSLEGLGTSGLPIAEAIARGQTFYYLRKEMPTGVKILGSQRSGKTTTACHLIREMYRLGFGSVVFCLRGDYVKKLAPLIPDVLLFDWRQLRTNPCHPPKGVELRPWLYLVASRMTLDLGLQRAGENYLVTCLNEIADICEAKGVVPAMPDIYAHLKSKKPKPRSSEEGYLERLLLRIEGLVRICGEVFDVQRGHQILDHAENGRVVIIHTLTNQFVCDFLTATTLFYLYYQRMFSDDPFSHPLVMFALDEQRSLLRYRRGSDLQPELDLLISRARALQIMLCVSEQIPSEISPSALNAPLLTLGLRTSPPQQAFVAGLLGLKPSQIDELSKLEPGMAIARLGGGRIAMPFLVKIPDPSE